MTSLNKKIGLVGAGNMGEAFAGAVIRSEIAEPSMVYMSDIRRERLSLLNKTYGVNVTKDSAGLFMECNVVILAVKPNQVAPVLLQIKPPGEKPPQSQKLVISIAAGITLKKIESILYDSLAEEDRKNLPVIRVMPNTPALVLSGMSGMSPNRYATKEDTGVARIILESMGKVLEFEEPDLDAVTALSGSGPAYIFYMVESMIEAGIKIGLTPEDSSVLTLTTLKGALALMEDSGEAPESLRRKVTSPGGTTEAALKVFQENGVKENIIRGIKAAAERSKELGRAG